MPEPSLGSGFETRLTPEQRKAILDLRRLIAAQQAEIESLKARVTALEVFHP